jgi:precorrin-6B methylase 2
MLTVDYDRLGVGPGTRVIDVGAGAGRHSYEAYRRGADVIAFDQDAEELAEVDGRKARLVAERDDLVEAIRRLRTAIQSLNREGRERLLAGEPP